MQPEFTNSRRDIACEVEHAALGRRVGQYDQARVTQVRDDVACSPQATPDRLADTAQAGIGRVPPEYLDVRIKVIDAE